MKRTPAWAVLALSVGMSVAFAEDPFKHSLVHGTFKPGVQKEKKERKGKEKKEVEKKGGAIHPLAPNHQLESIQDNNTFRILRLDPQQGPCDPFLFPVLKEPSAREAAALEDFKEGETFFCPVDLTGSGFSDLVYARKGAPGWRVLTNGQRLPRPVDAFVDGFYEKGSDSRRLETIPADTGDLTVDQDLLAATGDFLGNGTEQLAYTRPGATHLWIVGSHGVHTMRADLKEVEPNGAGPRRHWLFAYKAMRPGQHTRLAYYRAGSDHLVRLVPKGMEFAASRVPLKGNWERLNQAAVPWPMAAGAPVSEGSSSMASILRSGSPEPAPAAPPATPESPEASPAERSPSEASSSQDAPPPRRTPPTQPPGSGHTRTKTHDPSLT